MNFCCLSAPAGINGIQHNLSSKVTPEWFANSSVFYLLMSSCVSLTSVCPHCALRTMKGLFNQTHFKAFRHLRLWLLLFSQYISTQVNILIWKKIFPRIWLLVHLIHMASQTSSAKTQWLLDYEQESKIFQIQGKIYFYCHENEKEHLIFPVYTENTQRQTKRLCVCVNVRSGGRQILYSSQFYSIKILQSFSPLALLYLSPPFCPLKLLHRWPASENIQFLQQLLFVLCCSVWLFSTFHFFKHFKGRF